MVRFKTIKNSFSNMKAKFTHTITQEEALERYMNKLIDEAEEDLKNGGSTFTLEEWKEHMRRDYNIAL